MTMDYTDDDQPQEESLTRKQIRQLEKQAKAGKEALEELEQLKKERAYVAAGIPIDDKRTPYFMAGYTGEMTPEAIRAKWAEDFGAPSNDTGNADMDEELRRISGVQDLVSTSSADLSDTRLAERNAKLAELSMSDPRYPEKFEAIFQEYGGQQAARSNMTGL